MLIKLAIKNPNDCQIIRFWCHLTKWVWKSNLGLLCQNLCNKIILNCNITFSTTPFPTGKTKPFVWQLWTESHVNCLVYRKQWLELMTYQDSGLCSCNHLTKINDCGFGVILQACLVSKLQGPLSLGLKLSAIFQSFDLSKIFSLSQGISTPSLVQIGRHIRSQAICEDTRT
jgi:hypothetical protein